MRGEPSPTPTVCDCRDCACRALLSFSRRMENSSTAADRRRRGPSRSVEADDMLSPVPIGLPAMCDPHDQDDEGLVEDFVDDAVVGDTDPTQAEKVALQDASPEWTLSKVVDRTNDSAALNLWNASELPDGAPLDPNRVAHP